jgi:uncharacterized membrane protein YdjX (TVP38/TMEM64 family)
MTRRRIATGALLLAILALVVLSRGVHDALLRLLVSAEAIAADHPAWAATLVVVFAALSAMLVFVSSWVVLPFAVFTWGAGPALLLLWTGWLLGGITSYSIGRFLGRPAVRRLASRTALDRYEDRVSHRAPFGLILLFQLALPSEIPGYVLGLVRYPFVRYLAALGLVELVYGIATVSLGTGVVERRVALILPAAAALAILVAWAVLALRRRLAVEEGMTRTAHRHAR